jgi:Fic/DOC family
LAAWVHWAIARIHPFEDGNGRMARLWQDLLLLHGRLTVAIIRPEDRKLYYEGLGAADDGDCNLLVQLVCRRVMSTMQVYLSSQEEADELNTWAIGLTGEASARIYERRRLEYERWRHKAEQVRDAFERCATLITNTGNLSIEVQVRRYDLIDQSAWESLSAGGGAKKPWFFRLWFRREETIVWYIFFFERHEWTEADETVGLKGPVVGLHISEQKPGDQRAVRLDQLEDTPLSLRELVILDKLLLRRKWDRSTMSHAYDEVPAVKAAKEFMEEVIWKRLLR